LAVAEERHFGRAAARLYISQPSLSNQIHKLEQTLGTDLFARTSRHVELTTAGRALLEEAPPALAALERAAERARLAGAGIAGTVRLAYTPAASFETLGAVLAAVEDDNPTITVVPSELFSAEIPGQVLAGKVDVGIALQPESMRGVRSAPLRIETLVLLVGTRHRLADAGVIPLASLANETLLLFPRELAPAYYDRIIAACEQAGFAPSVTAFPAPPPQATLARLPAGREVSLAPASFGLHAAAAAPGVVARELAQPGILAEWSILWPARVQSAAITRFLDSARRCAHENNWLGSPKETTSDELEPSSPAPL
jgi:DNA-binding transcriptional LysR family regulator